MGETPTTYTGNDADIKVATHTHTVLGISDFSITFDRGVVEQELVGEEGNYFKAGALSIEGSLTVCKLEEGAGGDLLESTISGTYVVVSGSCGTNSVKFYFPSCSVTGFDISLGDADTVTEGSIDFVVMDPQFVTISTPDEHSTLIENNYS